MVLNDYTVDQVNMFTSCLSKRRLNQECDDISILFHAVAAGFGSKSAASKITEMLQERQRLVKLAEQDKVVQTPGQAGEQLLNQLRSRGVPVRRRKRE